MEQHLAHDDEPTRAIDRPTEDLRGYSRRAADGPPGIREGSAFGPYGILRRLGRGGMGTVWEAVHRPSGHRLALKVLNTGFATREDQERFLREGQIAASVSHPRSVYVYGTEEVDGHPVITMELMKGGTLWDALKASGQLPIRQAVDWTLEIVEGLQAAAETGILHRDIKPSNAFLDAGGRAKIGDYGLAWSTGRFALVDEAETFAGTPAYASPEQVRGERLDERSDIYAVGATLYQLLTGRMPIEADTLSGTLKAVLEALPVPPGRLRKGIPKGLERVVLGCLEKDHTRRPPSYTALTAALKPFSSQAPEPAPLPSRILAYGVDVLPWFLLEGLLDRFHPARNTTPLDGLLLLLIPGLVFFATEARGGASPGKRLFGLEVRDTAGDRPGWGAVALRTAVWMALFKFQFVLVMAVGSDWQDRIGVLGNWMNTLAMAALFGSMRRGNGYRGLHDWLSGTRVVARRPLEGAQRPEAAIPSEASGEAGRIGPYLLKERLREGALWLAWDPTLAREVWIREVPPGTAPLSEARRTASRVGSLHWMHASREGESWDAFEAVPGRSLADHARVGAPWEACRAWMLDLAEEVAARVAEGEPPGLLSGTRVWVGEDGHARLADFPVPSEADAPAFQEAQAFFAWMATALRREPWPLHAMELAADVEAGHLPAPGTLAAHLRGLQAKPARMTWRRRMAHLSAGLALPAIFLLLGVSQLPIPDHRSEDVLLAAVALLEQIERGAVDPRILGRAGHLERVALYEYRHLKRGPAETGSLDERARRYYLKGAAFAAVPRRLEPLDRSLPPLSREDRDRSYAAVAAPMDEALALSAGKLGKAFAAALSLVGLLGLLSSLACRGGLGFRMMGMAVVDRGGRAVSPWRGLLRGAAAWSPWMVALAFLVPRGADLSQAASRAVLALDFFGHGLSWAALALLAAGAGYALHHPGGGFQDRLAGTWLVPR